MNQGRDFSIKPTLTGEKVVLRPFGDDDLPDIRAVLLDPEARILTGSVHDAAQARAAESPGEEKLLLDWYRGCGDQADRLDLAVIDKAAGRCVGETVLNQWDPGNESCNFRILLGPAGRDRGLGTEATRLIVGYGFERLGLHRISLEVYAFNPRARRAYEKVGFRPEGVLRESLRYNGEWIDATIMSILAPEWAAGPRPAHDGGRPARFPGNRGRRGAHCWRAPCGSRADGAAARRPPDNSNRRAAHAARPASDNSNRRAAHAAPVNGSRREAPAAAPPVRP